jgi:hypothetical protein
MTADDSVVRFVEAILRGEEHRNGRELSAGIVGKSDHETRLMRAEWVARCLPRTAAMVGVEWDGVKRLTEREAGK